MCIYVCIDIEALKITRRSICESGQGKALWGAPAWALNSLSLKVVRSSIHAGWVTGPRW